MAQIRIIVAGAAGRMGRAVVRAALAAPGVVLAGGFERAGDAALGRDLGALAGLDPIGVAVEAARKGALAGADALIDFTTPSASVAHARLAAGAGIAHIIGATGFGADEEAEIAALAERIAIVKSGNMSLGVNLLAGLVKEAAARLSADYDIEIVEAHHRAKVDAPSGTALMLARAAAKGRGIDPDTNKIAPRSGVVGERPKGPIGFAVVRGGGVIGDHEVLFAGPDEVLALSHRALDRGLFARGAIAAARWAATKPPGLYAMTDVLGFAR